MVRACSRIADRNTAGSERGQVFFLTESTKHVLSAVDLHPGVEEPTDSEHVLEEHVQRPNAPVLPHVINIHIHKAQLRPVATIGDLISGSNDHLDPTRGLFLFLAPDNKALLVGHDLEVPRCASNAASTLEETRIKVDIYGKI
jgi:hypothetical protein